MESQTSEKGSLLGASLLIAGAAIGGGMLGLPIVTGTAGLYPAISIFCFCWVFMTLTALLLLEVNISFGININFITMAEKTLGSFGKFVSWITYLFLFYSMLVAYIDGSGLLTQQMLKQKMSLDVEYWLASLFFTALFGLFVYMGTLFVDRLNRLLMLGLILTYFFVIGFGAEQVEVANFSHKAWKYSFLAIPVTITSFGYHNIIPTLTAYLKKDRKKMIQTIIVGGAIPLVVYLLWDWLILGVVPQSHFNGKLTLENMMSYIHAPIVSKLAQYFAFFAIITSFLAQALALVDFLRDALGVSNNWINRIWLVFLVLTPPYIFSMAYPGVFINALGLVGGFAAIIIFVIMPVLMVWKIRYKRKDKKHKIVLGGRPMLILILLIGLSIMTLQFMQEFLNIKFLR